MVYPNNRVLLSAKKKWTLKLWKDTGETEVLFLSEKKPIWKGYTLYNSMSTTFLKRQGCGFMKKINARQGWVWEVCIRAQRICRAVNLFCTTLQWWIRVIRHLPKVIGCITPMANRNNVNYGSWRSWWGSPVVTRVPLWFEMLVDIGGGYACLTAGSKWDFSSLLVQFCYEPKTALKIQFFP